MIKKVFIFTEAGIKSGLGHLTRCLALYDAFYECNVNPSIIINGDSSVIRFLDEREYFIHDWLSNINKFTDQINNDSIVILDSYNLNKFIINNFLISTKKIVLIDDNNINYLDNISLVINTSIYAHKLKYNYTKSIIGTEYCLLRKEFWNQTKKMYKQDKTILLLFGGSELAVKISKQIYKIITLNFPAIDKILIVPNNINNNLNIDKKTKIFVSPTFKETFELMKRSDIAITASGQTIYELLSLGIPSIVCSISDNQSMNEQILEEKKLVLSLGNVQNLDNIDDNKLISKLNKLINDRILYESLSIKGQELIDGKGSLKAVTNLLKIL